MANKPTIESDGLGTRQIPAGALYGIATVRALDCFDSSFDTLASEPQYVQNLLRVKKACAEANAAAGVLTADAATAIQAACDELMQRAADRSVFAVSIQIGGGQIAVNMNINEAIAKVAMQQKPPVPLQVKAQINASQSTADVCHSAARLTIYEQGIELVKVLEEATRTMMGWAIEWHNIPTISRTCMRDASVVGMGTLFGGYAALLERRTLALRRVLETVAFINLGGTVIGSSEGASEAYRQAVVPALSKIVGRPLQLRADLYDAAQNADDIVAVINELGLIAESLVKVAKDIRLLSSGPNAGLNELQIAPVMEGSSFYPGKINPVMEETMLQVCFDVMGSLRSSQAAMEHAELNLNVFEGIAAWNTMRSLRLMQAGMKFWNDNSLKKLSVNHEQTAKYAAVAKSGGKQHATTSEDRVGADLAKKPQKQLY